MLRGSIQYARWEENRETEAEEGLNRQADVSRTKGVEGGDV